MSALALVLGDQLNPDHRWFTELARSDTTFVLAEVMSEATYARHHRQKIAGIFAAMSSFARQLRADGYRVLHLTLDDTAATRDFPDLIRRLCDEQQIDTLHYQRPDEYRLLEALRAMELPGVTTLEHDTEHFMVPFPQLSEQFQRGKPMRMEAFYRAMRRQHDLLMQAGKPLGGQWNYDAANRKKLKADDLARIPAPLTFGNDVTDILDRIERHKISTIGHCDSQLLWPINRAQALTLLAHFCDHCLPDFGRYQDAMTDQHEAAWSLFHSRLSFALNLKMLTPLEVVEAAIRAFETSDAISIEQIEGFVRQIVGWREFIRGIYWANMPDYAGLNHLKATRPLPDFFWTGDTDMNCLRQTITQSLAFGYAHHIQRLMITGNFCLIAGIDPAEVDAWYLGIYVDAFDWVELPNTRGMSQFADGGIVGSKPYSASGNYVQKMSDYCGSCRYKVKEKTGPNACPLNSLYWSFMERHRSLLEKNPRIGMVYRNWDRQDEAAKMLVLQQADRFLDTLET